MPHTTKNPVKVQASAEATPDMDTPESLASMIEDALEKHFSRAETSNNEHFALMEQRFDSLQTELSSLREETLALWADHSALLKRTEKLERTTASLSNSASATDLKSLLSGHGKGSPGRFPSFPVMPGNDQALKGTQAKHLQ